MLTPQPESAIGLVIEILGCGVVKSFYYEKKSNIRD